MCSYLNIYIICTLKFREESTHRKTNCKERTWQILAKQTEREFETAVGHFLGEQPGGLSRQGFFTTYSYMFLQV